MLWTLWVLDPVGVCGLAQPGKQGLLAGGGVGDGKVLCKGRILLCVKYWRKVPCAFWVLGRGLRDEGSPGAGSRTEWSGAVVRGLDQGAMGTFWPRWGDCVNQHSPLGSGVKLALCEEDRGWYCFV